MVFHKFDVLETGESHPLPSNTPDPNKNILEEAQNFFDECEGDYFPVLEIGENIFFHSPQIESCLKEMFILKQIEFFLMREWVVRLVNVDLPRRENCDFKGARDRVSDDLSAIMHTLYLSKKNYRVAGFVSRVLYVHLSYKIHSDAVIVS